MEEDRDFREMIIVLAVLGLESFLLHEVTFL